MSADYPPALVLRDLDLLSRTDPTLPGLSSLSLHCAIPTAEAANLLCSVLRHHSALVRLDLPCLSFAPCGPSPPAATVFRTLPQLTAILFLTLSAACLPPSPTEAATEAAAECVQAMAAAISALPRLVKFHLSGNSNTPAVAAGASGRSRHRAAAAGTPPLPKRRRIAAYMGPGGGAIGPPSLDPVIAALSTAPSLTSLKFTIPSAALGCPLPCSGIRGPFRTLQKLKYEGSDRIDAGGEEGPPPGMEALDTSGVRLPALTRLKYTNTSPVSCDDIGSLRRILAAAALHPPLEEVDFRLGKPVRESREIGFRLELIADCAPKEVSVRVECGMTEVAEMLQSGLPSLAGSAQALRIYLNSRYEEDNGKPLEGIEHVAPILQPLATFTSLQSLTVSFNLQPEDADEEAEELCDAVLDQPLQPLKLLTSLHIAMPEELLTPLSMVAKQLQGMVQLRGLSITGVTHAAAHEFEACFAPLTALTFFEVGVRPVTADLVRAWARAACAMPHLHSSGLTSCDLPSLNPAADDFDYADPDWFTGLLELPSWGKYKFRCSNEATPDVELEASVRKQLIERGADVGEHWQPVSFRETQHPADYGVTVRM